MNDWYSLKNINGGDDSETENPDEGINYKHEYKLLKKKLKNLIAENETYQETLQKMQKRLLIANQDRSFLLDRCLLYDNPNNSSSDSDETEPSDDDNLRSENKGKRKQESAWIYGSTKSQSTPKAPAKKRKTAKVQKANVTQNNQQNFSSLGNLLSNTSDGHMTPEEVERHLQSRHTYMELIPDRAPAAIPSEMFSNDASLDSESNDNGEPQTSPSNLGDDISIDNVIVE